MYKMSVLYLIGVMLVAACGKPVPETDIELTVAAPPEFHRAVALALPNARIVSLNQTSPESVSVWISEESLKPAGLEQSDAWLRIEPALAWRRDMIIPQYDGPATYPTLLTALGRQNAAFAINHSLKDNSRLLAPLQYAAEVRYFVENPALELLSGGAHAALIDPNDRHRLTRSTNEKADYIEIYPLPELATNLHIFVRPRSAEAAAAAAYLLDARKDLEQIGYVSAE